MPPTFAGRRFDLNIYATPAILTLILLTIESIFLIVALPETRGKTVKVEGEKGEQRKANVTAKSTVKPPVSVRIALLRRLRRTHLLFLGLFSGERNNF